MAKVNKSDTHKKGQIMTHKKVTKVTALKKDAMNNLLIFIESDANKYLQNRHILLHHLIKHNKYN